MMLRPPPAAWLCMAPAPPCLQELLEFNCVRPLRTVAALLQEKGGSALLTDPLLPLATAGEASSVCHTPRFPLPLPERPQVAAGLPARLRLRFLLAQVGCQMSSGPPGSCSSQHNSW